MELVQGENKFCIKDDSGKILGEIDFLADQNTISFIQKWIRL